MEYRCAIRVFSEVEMNGSTSSTQSSSSAALAQLPKCDSTTDLRSGSYRASWVQEAAHSEVETVSDVAFIRIQVSKQKPALLPTGEPDNKTFSSFK